MRSLTNKEYRALGIAVRAELAEQRGASTCHPDSPHQCGGPRLVTVLWKGGGPYDELLKQGTVATDVCAIHPRDGSKDA